VVTLLPPPGARAFLASRLAVYRHRWLGSLVTGVLEPTLYLAAMGLTLGLLVDRGRGVPGGVPYLQFLAPALLAAAAMQTGTAESTWAVMGGIRWDKTYDAVLATPVRVGELLAGHLLYVTFRVATTAALFLAVLACFGAARSPLVLVALPAAVLTGLAFATPITALAARVETDFVFSALQRFLVVPLFLFSGTFFPITQLPAFFRVVAWLTPLYHGVALSRGVSLGAAGGLTGSAALLHTGYLLLWTAAGGVLAARTFTRRLVR
jgi:lipooligosaccharide transport system permease protein